MDPNSQRLLDSTHHYPYNPTTPFVWNLSLAVLGGPYALSF